jgi:hypothetical protein
MHSHPGSTLLDESARITCGHSMAVGVTAQEGSARAGGYADQYLRGRFFAGKGANAARAVSRSDSIRGLRLKTGRKGSNFHQARGFPHWNARKLRGVLILTGNSVLRKSVGGGLGIGCSPALRAAFGLVARRTSPGPSELRRRYATYSQDNRPCFPPRPTPSGEESATPINGECYCSTPQEAILRRRIESA